MAAVPPVCDFGWKAPEFTLPGTDGRDHALSEIAGPKGTLVMFICNHCPYVLAVIDRIVRDGRDLQALGIGVARGFLDELPGIDVVGVADDPSPFLLAEYGVQFPCGNDL